MAQIQSSMGELIFLQPNIVGEDWWRCASVVRWDVQQVLRMSVARHSRWFRTFSLSRVFIYLHIPQARQCDFCHYLTLKDTHHSLWWSMIPLPCRHDGDLILLYCFGRVLLQLNWTGLPDVLFSLKSKSTSLANLTNNVHVTLWTHGRNGTSWWSL